jgi:peptidoglycan/LPS O-acetylase OafA/YrhL
VSEGKGFQIPSLDGFRTVSFFIVFIAHAGLNAIVPGPFGVTVFFFLSGYLITTLLRREQEKTGRISLSRFYLRRVLRILPPFYVVLGIVFSGIALGLLPPTPEPDSVRALLLHYANYYIVAHGHDGVPIGTGVYWSLAVEEHFYFAFPAIFLLLHKWSLPRWKQSVVLLGLCALVLAWRCYLVMVLKVTTFERTGMASDTRFDSILFGCVLALTENPALDQSAFSERTWKRWLFPLGVAGLLLGFLYRNEVFRETFRYTLQGLSLIPIFVCAVRYPTWWPIRPLNWRPIAYLGTLSYSLYLVHQLAQFVVSDRLGWLDGISQGLLAFAITFAVSWLIFQLVEKPCANLRRRLHA